MSEHRVDQFAESVGEYGLVHRTTAAKATETIATLIEEPAVGTPIPIEDVTLSELPVETDPTPARLEAARTGVTAAGLGVASYGTITIESSPAGEEPTSLFVDRHVAVIAASDLVGDMHAAIERIAADIDGDGASTHVLTTGPSATADMGELAVGVHGPRTVHVVVVTDR